MKLESVVNLKRYYINIKEKSLVERAGIFSKSPGLHLPLAKAGTVLFPPEVLTLMPPSTERTGKECGLFDSTQNAQGDMVT